MFNTGTPYIVYYGSDSHNLTDNPNSQRTSLPDYGVFLLQSNK